MTTKELQGLRAKIEAIAKEGTKHPTIPMDVYLQEAEDLHEWAQKDRKALEAVGVEWKVVETLPARVGAVREAQSQWNAQRFAQSEAARKYKELAPDGYDLRDQLVHHMLYAYRDVSDVLGRVRAIAEGDGHADMIQDLSDLAALGKRNPEPLKSIGADLKLLDRAAASSATLAELLAKSHGAGGDPSAARVLRDKAFTYLKDVVDQVREAGRYVFWRDRERARGYASAYLRRKGGKAKKEEEKPASEGTPS